MSGVVTDMAGLPVPSVIVELECCGPVGWEATRTDPSGQYAFEKAEVAVVYTVVDGYYSNSQLVSSAGAPELMQNLRLRAVRHVPAGQSVSLTIEPDSSLCWDGDTVLLLDYRCEFVTVAPERDGILTVAASPSAATVPVVFFANTGISGPSASVQVRAGKQYLAYIAVPLAGAMTPQRFEVSTSLR